MLAVTMARSSRASLAQRNCIVDSTMDPAWNPLTDCVTACPSVAVTRSSKAPEPTPFASVNGPSDVRFNRLNADSPLVFDSTLAMGSAELRIQKLVQYGFAAVWK